MQVRAKAGPSTHRTEGSAAATPAAPASKTERPPLLEPDLPRTWEHGQAGGRHDALATIVGLAAPAVAAVLVAVAAPAAADGANRVAVAPSGPGPADAPRADAPAAKPAPKVSAEERELATKVSRLADARFGGDYHKLFDHYAGDDHLLDRDELSTLLSDAGVGNVFTRGAWVSGVLEKLDKSGDGALGWTELEGLSRR